jgi:acylphosphatase
MPEPLPPAPATRNVEALIRGRVQGVGYRYWTLDQAERRGLSGHVRNRDDGSVEAVFHGPAEAVAAMLAACREGPPGARVEAVAVRELEGPGPGGAFRIVRG